MNQINLPNSLTEAVNLYSERAFLVMRGFISSEYAQRLLRTTANDPIRTVTCGDDRISFREQDITEEHPVFAFFQCRDITSLARQLNRTDDAVARLLCWTSIYEAGQYIEPHTDLSGDLQIIVCLQAPGQENGGELCVELSSGLQELLLAPGDAVIFNAAAIRHYTTPLVATKQKASPRRVVAVGRYFFR